MVFKSSISGEYEGCATNEEKRNASLLSPFCCRLERNPVQVLPSTLPLNFGCAMCSTFLSLPPFSFPLASQPPSVCLQDFSLPISGGLSQAPSACAKLRFPLDLVYPQHIPPRTHVPENPALTPTHTRARTPSRSPVHLPPGRAGARLHLRRTLLLAELAAR